VARKLTYKNNDEDNGDPEFRELFGDGSDDESETAENGSVPCEAETTILSSLPLHNHKPDVAEAALARWRLVILRRVVDNYRDWRLPHNETERREWCSNILAEADRSNADGRSKDHARPLSREPESTKSKVEEYMQSLIRLIETSLTESALATSGKFLLIIRKTLV
jgi:hypothetical protein